MEPAKRDAHSPQFVFCDDGGRPKVDEYSIKPKFRPNDRVYIIIPVREGPFLVSTVTSGRYTLCDANKRPVKNGKELEELELELEPEEFF